MKLKTSDIVLILPPHRWKEHRYSLGLLYVSAYLRQHGFDNLVIERGMFKSRYDLRDSQLVKELIVKKVKELKPKLVGFTCSIQEFDEVIEINKELKKELDFLSLVGGPQSTAKPDDFLKHGFDIAVVREGEQTALELVKLIEKSQSPTMELESIKGIAYKDEQGQIRVNPPREYMDIADLVLPAYDKIDLASYTQMWHGIVRGIPVKGALIMTSRGCPYACAFCDCNKVFGQRVRYRSLNNIRQEIKLLKEKYGVEGIWLADDTFTLKQEHILGVGKIMKELKIIWACQARVNLLNENLVKTMKKDGCVQFDFGVESGSPRVLDEIMNKQINLGQIHQAFKLCHKYKMRTLANFMIGLPTETRQEMEQTMQLARQLKANFYVFSIFTPLPGTTLFDKYFKDEIKTKDYKELGFFLGAEKFNKSQVRNIKELNTQWRKELAKKMKKRNLSWDFLWLYVKIFFNLKNKKNRLKYIWQKIKSIIYAN